MKNSVIIKTVPVTLSEKQQGKAWELQKMFAEENLECAQLTIKRDIEDMSINFKSEITLTLSVSLGTLAIKTDYSEVKSRKSRQLIKLYLSGDSKSFAKKWVKLL